MIDFKSEFGFGESDPLLLVNPLPNGINHQFRFNLIPVSANPGKITFVSGERVLTSSLFLTTFQRAEGLSVSDHGEERKEWHDWPRIDSVRV